jgi:hypothetical protein
MFLNESENQARFGNKEYNRDEYGLTKTIKNQRRAIANPLEKGISFCSTLYFGSLVPLPRWVLLLAVILISQRCSYRRLPENSLCVITNGM